MEPALADQLIALPLPKASNEVPYEALGDALCSAPYPETLVLDWTDYCNAKCFFCRRAKYEQKIGGKGEFIPFEKLKKLQKVLSKSSFLEYPAPSANRCFTPIWSKFCSGSITSIRRY